MNKRQLLRFLDDVISQGEALRSKVQAGVGKGEISARWYPRVVTVFRILGERADAWKHAISRCPTENWTASTEKLLGVLRAIREAVDHGMVEEIKDIAHADALISLLEHARELARDGHASAAGSTVVSVLYEVLHDRCERTRCLPADATSQDALIDALYLRGELDQTEAVGMRRVTAMADRGSADAHPPLTTPEIDAAIDAIVEVIDAQRQV